MKTWQEPLQDQVSRLARTLPQAHAVFLDSHTQLHRHTTVFLDSRVHHQNWTPGVIDSQALCYYKAPTLT